MEQQLLESTVCLTFDDNNLLMPLLGECGKHLDKLEERVGVTAASRGNVVSLTGEPKQVKIAENVLLALYERLKTGMALDGRDVEAAIRMSQPSEEKHENPVLIHNEVVVKTPKRLITPKSDHQRTYISELFSKTLTFGIGPAGTGKTYIAVAVAVSLFSQHKVDRIILSRPAVEAGEKIGFLPGDMKEKVDPYLQPLYDALHDMLPAEKVAKYLDQKLIEIAPLAFMRGRTLDRAFIILDEAQNATKTQMKMFLTRLGEGSKMAISGDVSQIDLPRDTESGLKDAVGRFAEIEDLSMIHFSASDIIRHPLVEKIVRAYEQDEHPL